MTDHIGIIPYDPYRGAADLGRLWVLKKGKQDRLLKPLGHPSDRRQITPCTHLQARRE